VAGDARHHGGGVGAIGPSSAL